MALEYREEGNGDNRKYRVVATSCPVCGEELGEYQTLGRHVLKSRECREAL